MGTVYGLRYDKSYYINKLKEKYGDRFIYDKVDFESTSDYIILICTKHKIEFKIKLSSCLKHKNINCPLCKREKISETKKSNYCGQTTEEFIEKASKVHKNKYDYSKVDMLNRDENGKVCIICPIHGEFWQKPSQHLIGKGCAKCGSKLKTTEQFCREVKLKFGDRYDLSLVDYKNAFTKIKLKCNVCDTVYEVTPHNLLKGRGCPQCEIRNKKERYRLDFDIFKERVNDKFNGKYDLSLVKYVNGKTNIKIICPIHGIFEQTPQMLYKGHGCPYCGQSSLENEIQTLLENNNIYSIFEYRKDWLGKQSLDFYLPDYNVAIECQGIQHFKPTNFGKKSDKRTPMECFEYTIKCDNKKKKLCDKQGVKLLYYSNLGIEYPYDVFEDKDKLLEEIKKNIV